GNFQMVALNPWFLSPSDNRILWQLVSHKLLRLAVPWALLAFLAATVVLAAASPAAWPRALLAVQTAGYAAAALGWGPDRRGRAVRLFAVPCAFVVLNVAAAAALFSFVRRGGRPDWKQSASAS